jgi:hypothetical protein
VIVCGTLIGVALLTLWVGMIANRHSRRRLLLAASLPTVATGAGFAVSTAFWPLLVIAIVGTINPTAGDASVFSPLSQSRRLVYGMTALFGMDSFGTGFLVQSPLALWLYQSFSISVATAASILFWTSICSAISCLVTVPIAARIGLINTMVFTHLPSNVLLILIPFAPNLTTAIGLLLARSALSQMDVPTRSSYVMAVVHTRRAPGGGQRHGGPQDVRLDRGLDHLGLSADPLDLRLAAGHRRGGQGGHLAADQLSEGAPARRGRRPYRLMAFEFMSDRNG